MLTLLGRPDSGNVQKVLWCLAELGLGFERLDYGGRYGMTDSEAYRRVNPNGTVPTLLDGGHPVWESNTILRYLCNAHGGGRLYPRQPLARVGVERWMDWQLAQLAPALVPLFRGLVREQLPSSRLERERRRTEQLLCILDSELRGRSFLVNEQLTLADIALGPFVHRWLQLPLTRPDLPNLTTWHAELTRRPAFTAAMFAPSPSTPAAPAASAGEEAP